MTHATITGAPCEACGTVQAPPIHDDFIRYFEGRMRRCENCGNEALLWDVLLSRLLDEHPMMPGVVAIGLGKQTIIQQPMNVGTATVLALHEYGIPLDASVIDAFFTGVGDNFPTLGMQRLHARDLPHLMPLYRTPVPGMVSEDANSDTATTNVLVTWLPKSSEPEQEPLFTAARAFTCEDYRGTVLPAQISVELKLQQVLEAHYEEFGSRSDVRQFLTDGATYGHQLKFLLPSLLKGAGAPPLPEAVRVGLASLRKKRNKVGHEHAGTTRSEAAAMLLAGVFGYEYLLAYGELLAPPSN